MMAAIIIKRGSLLLPKNYCLACARLSSGHSAEVRYPAIKPKYPEGSWYSFSPKDAWRWYEDVEAIDALDTISRRLYYNHGSKHQLYYFDVKPYLNGQSILQFQEEITKSCLNSKVQAEPGVELSSDRWLSIVSDIKSVVTEEFRCFNRQADKGATEEEWQIQKRRFVLNTVLNRLLVLLTSDVPELLNYDLHNNINVQTHWARGGERTPSNTFAQVMYRSGVIRYGYWQNVDFQLRNCLPLSTDHIEGVTAFSRPLDPQPPPEALHCYHEAFKARRKEIDESLADFNPHVAGLYKKCYSLPHEPGFKHGALGEFVTLSVVSPGVKELRLKDRLREKIYRECLIGTGLINSFATSHAVAHYQGYDMHHDLVSPLLTSTIVTDGIEFTCVTHQLSTLRLFVHDIDNNIYNAYSRSETSQLYHTIDSDGTMIGFNPDCIKMLGQCMLAKCAQSVSVNPHLPEQVKTPSSGDLLPYLPTYGWQDDTLTLDPSSVPIPTYIRYTRANDPLSEWDLSRERRRQRYAEKKAEQELTKGPLHDSYEPPSRGRVILDRHFERERKVARQKRTQWRDEVLEYNRLQENSTNPDSVE